MELELELTVSQSISYVMHHNGVGALIRASARNSGQDSARDVGFRLRSDPEFFAESSVAVSSVAPGASVDLAGPGMLSMDLMPDAVLSVAERVPAKVLLEAFDSGGVIASAEAAVMLLPYDDWPGVDYPEGLASFVTPNADSVVTVTSAASDHLRDWGMDPALEGYQGGRDRVLQTGSALFAALESLNINYIVPPAGFESRGQRIRMADDVVAHRQGTCIDLAVLYASALEAAGLNALLFIVRGHAFAGFWLEDEWMPQIQEFDPAAITRQIRNNRMRAVECTLVTNSFRAGFEAACEAALRRLDDAESFGYAIDVRRARMTVRPLPTRRDADGRIVVERPARDAATSAPASVADYGEIEGGTDLTRVDKWSRELLDISLRNNMVSMRPGAKVAPLLVTSTSDFEDALAEGREFVIQSRPQEWDGAPLYGERPFETGRCIGNYSGMEGSELRRGVVRVPLSDLETERTLRSIYRNATKEMEEGGCNSLFVSLGVLRWYEGRSTGTARYAPLILVPVSMKKRQKGYSVGRLDEEPFFNVTVLEKLRQDFEIEMPPMDPLPADDSGVNVNQILRTVRSRIAGREGWDVLDGASLGVFSFSRYVMWNDLQRNIGRFRENRLVDCLVEGTTFQGEKDIAGDCEPEGLCLTVPADGSQIRAVRALASGRTFVLHGPPGTGKSQTITNMICNELYAGRTVLFVAEKRAALEVVQKRLDDVGIGNHCLEMHSNKAEKTKVLDQLRSSLDKAKQYDPAELDRTIASLESTKTKLDAYVNALHERRGWGLSAYECISRYESCGIENPVDVQFPVSVVERLGADAISDLEDDVRSACRAYALVSDIDDPGMRRVRTRSFAASVGDDVSTAVRAVRDARSAADRVRADIAATGLPVDSTDGATAARFFDSIKTTDPRMSADPALSGIPAAASSVVSDAESLSGIVGSRGSVFSLSEQERSEVTALCDSIERGSAGLSAAGHVPAGDPLASAARDIRTACSDAVPLLADHLLITSAWRPEAIGSAKSTGLVARWREAKSAGFFAKRKARSGFVSSFSSFLKNPSADFDSLEQSVNALERSGDRISAVDSAFVAAKASIGADAFRDAKGRAEATLAFARDHGVDQSGIAQMRADASAAEHLAGDLGEALRRLDSAAADLRRVLDYDGDIGRDSCAGVCDLIESRASRVYDWAGWNSYSGRLSDAGLESVVEQIRAGVDEDRLAGSTERAMYRTMINMCRQESEALRMFNADSFEKTVGQYKSLDATCTNLNRNLLRYRLYRNVPQNSDIPGSESAVLFKAINASRLRMSIRNLLASIPNILPRICPCFLMSPLSVAQYITTDYPKFDTVIFDESSQITTCKAVGALGRAGNAVIAGDSKQLPPTTFFQRKSVSEDDDEMVDIDSFLDEALATDVASTYLEWHYRSRHESLITFSNRMFYGNRMLTFPSPDDAQTRVVYVRTGGEYVRGMRTNPKEAAAVVDEMCRRMRDPALRNQSIGVIAFSVAQQECIQDALDDRLRRDSALFNAYNEMPEGVFIKNLETVQGDERDVILFSIGYGPDSTGTVHQNFGPINLAGGGRRLNVAVSRARCEMVVFSSISSTDIRVTPTSSAGLKAFKEFIRFAENGGRFGECDRESPREGSTAILASIARELRARGYGAHFDVGTSEFRVDIAVYDPADPGEYLLGILSDGESYTSSANTRDREYARPDVLRRLGWRLMHVWSVDWYFQREKTLSRILDALEAIKADPGAPAIEESVVEGPGPIEEGPEAAHEPEAGELLSRVPEPPAASQRVVRSWAQEPEPYEVSQDAAVCSPEVIRKIAAEIIARDSPIDENHLVDQYKQVTGIRVLSAQKRESLVANLRGIFPPETRGSFVTYWAGGDHTCTGYRVPPEGEGARPVASVSLPEMTNAILDMLELSGTIGEEDMVTAVSKALGYRRMGGNIRERVAEAIGYAVEDGVVELRAGRYRIP